MKKCANCNKTYPDNINFCGDCGVPLTYITQVTDQAQASNNSQDNNNIFYDQQNYNQNPDVNFGSNAGNVYNPSNSYSSDMPNQNNVEEGGIITWLPLILSILSFFVFGIGSVVAFVLLIRNKHSYKFPNIAKILSIISMALWIIGVFFM